MHHPNAPLRLVGLAAALLATACGATVHQTDDAPLAGDSERDAASLDVAPPPDDMTVARDVPVARDVVAEDVPVARDVPVAEDVPVARDVPVAEDVPVARDVPAPPDAAVSCAAAPGLVALAPSTQCTARSARAEVASLCGAASPCPITEAVAMECQGGGYGPWLAASPERASVLFTTNVGGFRSRLLTVPREGAARVDDVPFLTSAANALGHDRAGARYLVAGEMPGAVLHRETPGGWSSQPLSTDGSALLLVSAAAMLDERRGYALFLNLRRNAVDIAATRDGCWSREELSPNALWRAGLSLDARDRPWSTWHRAGAGGWELHLRGPDGDLRLASYARSISNSAEAQLVPALPSNTDLRPTVATFAPDGEVHLHEPAAAGAYTDRPIPSPGPAASDAPCTGGSPGDPGGVGCMGSTTCTQRVASSLAPFGVARTADGSLWVARLYADWTTDYRRQTMCIGGPRCVCTAEPVASRGVTELRLQRVRGAEVREALRLTLSRTRPVGVDRLPMIARGATLSLVAPVAAATANGTSLRYLEIDTAMLR